ncbi:MAG: APC family permease [Gemmatimonadaceae bacterium]
MQGPELVRSIGKWSLAGLVLNAIIGSGVFVLPGTVAGRLGSLGMIAWIVAGAITGAMILCFAEVASRFTAAGGAYVFVQTAFGRYMGLQAGAMMYFTRIFSAAVQANLFATYFAEFWAPASTWLGGLLLSTVFIGFLTAVNIRSVASGAKLSNFFALMKLGPLLLFGFIGLLWIATGHAVPSAVAADATLGSWMQVFLLLLFAYGGFESALTPFSEAKDPRRDAPFALLVGLALVVLVYLTVQATILATLADPDATNRPLAGSARVMLGAGGAIAMTLAALISVYGWLASNMLTVPRITMAMADGGDAPAVLGRIHSRFRTPWVSIVVFGVLAWLLANSAGLHQNISLSAVSRLFVYGSVCAALPVFRRMELRDPARVGAAMFRAPAGLVMAGIGVAAATVLATRMNLRETLTMAVLFSVVTAYWFVVTARGSRPL